MTQCQAGPSFGQITRLGIAVAAPRTTTANLKLPLGGTITGTVRGRAGHTARLGDVCVNLLPADPRGTTESGYTGSRGQYRLADLAPGRYRVLIP